MNELLPVAMKKYRPSPHHRLFLLNRTTLPSILPQPTYQKQLHPSHTYWWNAQSSDHESTNLSCQLERTSSLHCSWQALEHASEVQRVYREVIDSPALNQQTSSRWLCASWYHPHWLHLSWLLIVYNLEACEKWSMTIASFSLQPFSTWFLRCVIEAESTKWPCLMTLTSPGTRSAAK